MHFFLFKTPFLKIKALPQDNDNAPSRSLLLKYTPHLVARNRSRDVVFARKHGPIKSPGSTTTSTGETTLCVGFFFFFKIHFTKQYVSEDTHTRISVLESNFTVFIIQVLIFQTVRNNNTLPPPPR